MKQFLYGYDQAGNRKSEQIGLGVTGANYNNVNQLTTTIGGGPVRFVGHLDEPGTVLIGTNAATMGLQSTSFVGYAQTALGTNVVTVTATDYSSNSRTNRYQVVITNNSVARVLSYDLNGNETSAITATSTNTYEWDAADRLVAINNGPNRSEFMYDGMGRRVRIVEKANAIIQTDKRFLWCETELCEERDSGGGTVTKRFFARGEQISGTNYYLTRDHVGSVREMTDGTGSLRARYEYDPYGRRTKVSGDVDADFVFTGHYYHATSGLYLTLYRAYDCETGRWLSRDPIAESAGLNLYGYVLNSPINFVDPYGLNGAAAMAAFRWGLTRAGLAEALGLGPENPLADIAAGLILAGSILYAGWEYFHNNAEAAKPAAGKCPTPAEVKGKPAEEIAKELKDKGWVGTPTREGEGSGTRYANPDKPGEQVRVMPGKASDPNPVKQGPYVRISTDGKVSPPIPIAGNPTLTP